MNKYSKFSSLALFTLLLSVSLSSMTASAKKTEYPEQSHDGLQRVHKSKVDLAYVKPGVDFSDYNKFMVLDSYVAFKKDWQKNYRDINRKHLSTKDLEKMKSGIAELFHEVYVKELQKKDGYEVVTSPAEDVLILRPAIIDVQVTAPLPNKSMGRSRTYSSTAGDATLYLEVFDSLSGEILARIVDRREVSQPGNFVQWSNGVSNRAAAKRVFAKWAKLLRKRFDQIKMDDNE